MVQFLLDTQKELVECEENAKLVKNLENFLREFSFNNDIVSFLIKKQFSIPVL